MEPIFPLHEERISQFCGQVVCAVMKDGTRYVGVLSSCKGGRLMLNDHGSHGHTGHPHISSDAGISAAKPDKKKNSKSKKAAKEAEPTAETQAFGPYGYGYNYGYGPGYYPFGPPIGLELGLLAFLFLLL
ncbi:hypothetical protein [Paenibacillus daejeonensis]|uniref:hypothetical protein n=1 Tax=Paenibacillus daejeonensis TaxID=135193 RepID=UPI0003794FB6|nr:hypothetical protein [Paenibacillus daejeonensis]